MSLGSVTPVSRDRVVMSRGRPLLRTSALAKKFNSSNVKDQTHCKGRSNACSARDNIARDTPREAQQQTLPLSGQSSDGYNLTRVVIGGGPMSTADVSASADCAWVGGRPVGGGDDGPERRRARRAQHLWASRLARRRGAESRRDCGCPLAQRSCVGRGPMRHGGNSGRVCGHRPYKGWGRACWCRTRRPCAPLCMLS